MSATFISPQYTVHVPTRSVAAHTYRRRRLTVALFLFALVGVIGTAASHSLADRGGDPASVTSIGRPLSHVAAAGDTLWSIARLYHGHTELSAYVDALVQLNGGPTIQVGQVIALA